MADQILNIKSICHSLTSMADVGFVTWWEDGTLLTDDKLSSVWLLIRLL